MKSKDFLSMLDWSRDELDRAPETCHRHETRMENNRYPQTPSIEGENGRNHFPQAVASHPHFRLNRGIYQLGGYSLYITEKEIELGKRETIEDAARVLSRYLGTIVIRTFSQDDITKLAEWADVPGDQLR